MPKKLPNKARNLTTRTLRSEIVRPRWDGTKLVKAKDDSGIIWDVTGWWNDTDMLVLSIQQENLEDESHE